MRVHKLVLKCVSVCVGVGVGVLEHEMRVLKGLWVS